MVQMQTILCHTVFLKIVVFLVFNIQSSATQGGYIEGNILPSLNFVDTPLEDGKRLKMCAADFFGKITSASLKFKLLKWRPQPFPDAFLLNDFQYRNQYDRHRHCVL